MTLPILGIIAGNGALPLEIIKSYKAQHGSCHVAGIEGECNETSFASLESVSYRLFSLGSVAAVVDYFKQRNVTHIVFAGGVNRPNLKSVKVDSAGAILLAKIIANKFIGDDQVLRVVAGFFEQYGFKVISVQDIYQNQKVKNIVTLKKASKQEIDDIELGSQVIRALSLLDIGQSVIVENGYVLGIEAAEGTDRLIERCAHLRKKTRGGVLVKMPKAQQDMRLDLPTIGENTIKRLALSQYSGIAISMKGCIVLDAATITKLADQYDIFIYDID